MKSNHKITNERNCRVALRYSDPKNILSFPELFTPVNTIIHNARTTIKSSNAMANLNQKGFTLLTDPLDATINIKDPLHVRNQYFTHMQNLFTQHLGCSSVMPLNFVFRKSSTLRDTLSFGDSLPPGSGTGVVVSVNKAAYTGAIGNVHADFTADSVAIVMIREMMESDDTLRGGRFAIYNVWRPLEQVKRWPLAICDASTVDGEKDLVGRPTPENNNSVLNCLPPPMTSGGKNRHQWFYYPEMTANEILIFRSWDETNSKQYKKGTLHTAFDDPYSKDNDPARQSIEARFVCFWPPSSKSSKL